MALNVEGPIQTESILRSYNRITHLRGGKICHLHFTPHCSSPLYRFGEPGKIRYKFTLVEWAQRPEVANAWKELAEKHDLMNKQFRDVERVFSFTDAALGWSQNVYFSADKARSMGWHGHINSAESIFEVLRDFERIKMISPIPEEAVVNKY